MNPQDQAVEILKKGGIVIYPTETVYGIGCLLSFPHSIERLYEIKKRDPSQPTSVLFPSRETAQNYIEFNPTALKLASAFWPGALTMCLPSLKNVPEQLLGPDNTLGVRVPGSEWLRNLLEAVGEPLLAPSANFKGEAPARLFAEIDKNLASLVDYVVEVEPSGLQPSTIIKLTENNFELIREGDIKKEMLAEVLDKGN